jgi:hypothetical protein
MNSPQNRKFFFRGAALGLALLLPSCFSGLGYWQNAYFGGGGNNYQQPNYPQGNYGPNYGGYNQPQQPSRGGFFRRWNTDYAPNNVNQQNGSRYGYNGNQQPYYSDPNGTQYQRPSAPNQTAPRNTPPVTKPKPKSRGESASNLHSKPKPKPTTSPVESAPKETPAEPKPKPTTTATEVPKGVPVTGKPGFVLSPYAKEQGMVDVTGMASGTKVECPYTLKHFRVP